MQEKDEYKEQIVTCFQESKSNNKYFQIILSKCSFFTNFYEIEKIKIETGFDLIGVFDEKKSTIFEGMQFINYTDKEKIKDECSIFNYNTINMYTYKLIGDTTLDRKNVTFYFYYSKDLKVQIIQAKGSFFNESSIVDFEMNPSVDLEKGNVFIPSQVCQAENGEYLYIKNSGYIYQNYMNIYSVDITNPTTIPTTVPTTLLPLPKLLHLLLLIIIIMIIIMMILLIMWILRKNWKKKMKLGLEFQEGKIYLLLAFLKS